jgi:phage protein D
VQLAAGLTGLEGDDFAALKKKYGGFYYPRVAIEFGGKPFQDKSGRMVINEISVELTSGYEASVASFRIYGVYKPQTGKFEYDGLKKQVLLGNALTIKCGYLDAMETVFAGFVAGVNFVYSEGELPYVEITGMDVKGIMMSGSYAEQLASTSYGEAVREILRKTAYEHLQSSAAITKIAVTDTPDKKPGGEKGAAAYTIEMSSESDYEFVVKAAKKFNYEFFTDRGAIYFRKAKSNAEILLTIGLAEGLLEFDIGYSITGMAETVEALSVDAGTGKIILAKKKFTNNLSIGSYAKKLIAKSRRVYIDPTIVSKEHADARAASLLETMSYRLGALNCTCIGIPELQPGRFIRIKGLGSPADNKFYLTSVVHTIASETGYRAKLTGCANAVQKQELS